MREFVLRFPRLPSIVVALLLFAGARASAQDVPKGYDQGLFEVRIPGNAAVTVAALVNPAGGLLLPVGQIVALTGLPEERSRGDSIRSIPQVGGDRRVVLDLTIREIRRSGERIPVPPNEALIVSGETFLLTERLAEFLQADVSFDWSTLLVVISRNPPFPVERKHDVESRRSAARDRQGAEGLVRPPLVSYPSRNGGYVLEWSLSTNTQDLLRSFGGQSRFGIAVAGGDLAIGAIYTETPTLDEGRWHGTTSYRRAFPNWNALRQLELGDIVVGGATYQTVRGFNITNAAVVRDQFFSTLPVSPIVPLGWEYEVYQSGQLIGYSDAATQGAIGVPLRYGTTPVQVRLLSPAGEEIISDMTFLVPPSLLQPGRFEYAGGGGECSTIICDGFGYVDLKYGALPSLTAGAGVQKLWGIVGTSVQPYGSLNYARFSGWQAELQGAKSLYSRASVSYYGLAPFNGGVIAGVNSPGIGQPSFLGAELRRWYTDARLGYRLAPGARFATTGIRFDGRTEGVVSSGADHYRLGIFADRHSGSVGLNYEKDRSDSDPLYTLSVLTVLPERGPRWLHHNAFTTSAGFRSSRFDVLDFNSSLRLTRTSSVGLTTRWSQQTHAASASISLNSSLGFARSTSRMSAAPRRGADASTTLAGVATYDPHHGMAAYEMGGIGSAGLAGIVFYDLDADGKFTANDSVASGIGLVIGGMRHRTDQYGQYRTWNVVPYELVEITIDTLKGIAPNWIPLSVRQFTRATPHMYGRFDIPLIQTRELAGAVVADSGVWTSGGITVLFRNTETGQTSQTVTFSDGAFYVSRMKPGTYEVSLSQSALDAVGAKARPDRVTLTIPLKSDDALIDMPAIHLYRPETVEQKVVVTQAPKCPGVPEGTPVDSVGCPLPPPAKRVVTLKGVSFEMNKAELTTSSFDVLDEIAEGLKESPELRLEIAGHTDATGTRERNMALSLARAEAVRRHLIAKGVDSTRVVARGYGPDMPIASNRTPEGRALNRRTELWRFDQPRDSAALSADSLKALGEPEYSVEVGALRTGPAAVQLRDRLVKLGFDARVVGETSPFRVRVGRFPLRRDATSLVAQLKAKGFKGTIVRAELQ